jgi:F0F1-type ATP synthase delta subunit
MGADLSLFQLRIAAFPLSGQPLQRLSAAIQKEINMENIKVTPEIGVDSR